MNFSVRRRPRNRAGIRAIRVALVLKSSEGGLWTLPHIDALLARGHQVSVLLPGEPGRLRTALQGRAVDVVDSAFDFRFRPRPSTLVGLVRLRRQVRATDPDVIHYHLYASALAARFAGFGLRPRRVHMVAGPLYLDSPVIRFAERTLRRLDDVTIGGSEYTAARYRELGCSAERSPAIPYGVDPTYFYPATTGAAVREQLGIPAGSFVVVMVALFYPPKRGVHAGRGVKGHEGMLRAWHAFQGEHPGSYLLLVGDGIDAAGRRYRRELRADQLAISDGANIVWVDMAEDVRPYYAAADLSVSPSLSDNHGAALEAGSMSVPSIVTHVGALPEAVPPGTGWIVPTEDDRALAGALAEAWAEHRSARLEIRGRRARANVVENFDRRKSAIQVAEVIESSTGSRMTARAHRRYSVFTEARFGRNSAGDWAALDSATGPASWQWYLSAAGRVQVVARADRRMRSGSVDLTEDIDLSPLPYYIGLAQLFRRLPLVVLHTGRAVARAQVIVLRVPGVIGSIAGVACHFLRRDYAVYVVGDPADVLDAGVLGTKGRALRRLVMAHQKWLIRNAAASRFVTDATLQRRYPPRAGTSTVGIAETCLTREDFVAGPRRWPSGANLRVVTIGSQETMYKGHDVLLRAVRDLAAVGLDVSATIVGGGRLHDDLVSLAAQLGVSDRVCFTGAITSRTEINRLLDEAHLFVLPSRTEGLPRALVEAMARGLPALGSEIGGIPELLEPAFLTPVDDHRRLATQIEVLLTDPALWEAQSARNLRAAWEYEAAALYGRFESWLHTIPAARRRSEQSVVR